MTRCFTDMCDVYIMGTFTFDTRQQKIVPKKPRLTMVKMWLKCDHENLTGWWPNGDDNDTGRSPIIMIWLLDKPEMTLWTGFKLETFSGVITYRVSQTYRLVIMTTKRRAGNPGTPGS